MLYCILIMSQIQYYVLNRSLKWYSPTLIFRKISEKIHEFYKSQSNWKLTWIAFLDNYIKVNVKFQKFKTGRLLNKQNKRKLEKNKIKNEKLLNIR